MKSRRNPNLRTFVEEVRRYPNGELAHIPMFLAIAAADFIEKRLLAASKGGTLATKKKPGRPVTNKTRSAELTRARVRRHRAEKNPAKAAGGFARAAALSPEERSNIARNAAKTRWSKE